MINFCPKCHSIINDGAVFCKNCGVNILDFKETKEPIQADIIIKKRKQK